MNKIRQIIQATLATTVIFLFTGAVFAGSMSVKLEAPKSPTTLTDLKIAFVVLDYASDGAITAKCFYSKDGGGFAQFGGDIAIATGGGTANCTTTSSQINGEGTYKFKVEATNSSETVSSAEVTVVYNNSAPGTPTNYGKSRANVCDYKISFKTADDGGKTVKVEVYRSSNTSFTADAGSRVDTISIGSNTEGSSTTTPPNCSTDYYFAVRAFDSSGRGSGLVGDSVTTSTTTVSGASGASGTAGAIPAGTGGNVLGASNGPLEGPTGASGGVLGEASASPTPMEATYTPPTPNLLTGKTLGLGAGAIAVILLAVWLLRRKQNPS